MPLWWSNGKAADVRTYSNAKGYISYLGVPKLYLANASFVITTYYPSQAQIRNLNPMFAGWVGDIGTGANQTGYGFGILDTTAPGTDPAWLALFAGSNYMVKMPMLGITSTTTLTEAAHTFTLEIDPADPPLANGSGGKYTGTGEANAIQFPLQDTQIIVNGTTSDNTGGADHYFFVKEIYQAPANQLGFTSKLMKYWNINTTFSSFDVNLRFTLNPNDFMVQTKAPADWKIFYRVNSVSPWLEWPAANTSVILPNSIQANNVTQKYEFTVFSTVDETLPVELTAFAATVNAQNLITLSWSTASETSMIGYRVHYKLANTSDQMVCITPNLIPANNSSNGANYSFTATDITTPGTYQFYLEAVSMDGSSQFFGPVNATLSETVIPPLPERNLLSDAWPNPFNTGNNTTINVEMKAGESGLVTIYNVSGQAVKTYPVTQGLNSLIWNGMDSNGNSCSSGVYFYKLTSPSLNQTKKMMLIK